MNEIHKYIDEHKDAFIDELKELCNLTGIAAQNVGIEETGEYCRQRLAKLGAETKILKPNEGHPAVYGEIDIGAEKTLLFYNHFDVQPPEPLEEWESEPFETTVRDGRIFARGASDNKGDLIARILAVEAYQAIKGMLPVNIKFFVEGEEEIGSVHLESLVTENRELLKADGCLWEGGGKNFHGRPAMYLGLKGLVYFEFTVKGAKTDLHSSIGTIVPNPAWRLVQVLNTLRAPDGRILIEGFYDNLAEITPEDEEWLRDIPSEEEELKEALGLTEFANGLTGYELVKQHLMTPACNLCGIISGYTGEGTKTVLPRVASAKVGFRLVPNQDANGIVELVQQHLRKHKFDDLEVTVHSGENPARNPRDAAICRAAEKAIENVVAQKPIVYPLMAGSGPMHLFSNVLGIPTASFGVAHADSRTHAPNENILVEDYINGIKQIAELIELFAKEK